MLPKLASRGKRLFVPRLDEREKSDLYRVLTDATNVGLKAAGSLTLIALSVFLIGRIGIGGASPRWEIAPLLSAGEVLIPDKIAISALGIGAVLAGYARVSLHWGRALGVGFGILVGMTSLYGDLLQGDLSLGYLTTTFVTTAVLIPFRPWQTFLVGTSFVGLLLGVDPVMRTALGLSGPDMVDVGDIVQMAVVTLVVSTISAVLYRQRYNQHEAFREVKALSQRLAETERAKNRFFANLSHEFRTPLTLLLGPLQDALKGRYGDLPDPLHRHLIGMKEQVQRLQRLIDQLLRLSELDEGEMELEICPIDVSQFLGRMASLFRSMADQEEVNVRVESNEDIQVWADPDALRRIVSNLLKNALEHTPEGGVVRLQADLQEKRNGAGGKRQVAISVRDSGPGLPEEVQKGLFDRYVGESNRSYDPVDVTNGIGLAIVKELTERHGGSVEVETERGFGTEITTFLPNRRSAVPDEDLAPDLSAEDSEIPNEAVDPAVHHSDREPPEVDSYGFGDGRSGSASRTSWQVGKDEAGSAEGRASILVADDEEAVRGYLCDVLTPRYAVRTAPDGERALKVAQEEIPDLIISDVRMPNRDGFGLCQALREDDQLRSVPVVLLTVQKQEESRMEGIRRGADAYLEKPFRPAELRQRVENLIDVRRYIRAEEREGTLSVEDPIGISEARDEEDSDSQRSFADAAQDVVEAHLDNGNFGVDLLAEEMNLSARQLQRRLQDEASLSAAAFIRAIRLKHAAKMLRDGTVDTVKEAASAVGYRDPSHFSQLFKEAHGHSPSELKS